jgi:hypothetical protein
MKRDKSLMLFSNSGQALVENVLIIPILVIIVVMIFWFAEILLTKQQLVMAARYGTDLIVYSNLNEGQIRGEIRDYLCAKNAFGRRLDPRKLTDDNIKVDLHEKFKKFDVFDLPKLRDAFAFPLDHTCYVEIYYPFDTPKLFSAWDKYIGGGNIIKKLRIGARSEVLAGTGCQGDD